MSTRAVVQGIGACIIWVFCNIANKQLLDQGVAPLTLLLMQLLVSAPCLWIIVLAWRKPLPKTGMARLLRLGIWQPGIAYGASLVGLSMTTVTVEALIFSTETLIIIFLAWVMLGERPGRKTIAAGIAGSIGVALVVGIRSSGPDNSGYWGAALILAGTLAAALYSIFLRREVESIDPVSLIAIAQSGGVVAVAAIWILYPAADGLANLSWQTLPLIAVSGVMMHSVGFVLFAKLLQRMEAGTASLLLLIIPVLTAALGYAVLGERLEMLQIFGAAIVLAAMAIEALPAPRLRGAGQRPR